MPYIKNVDFLPNTKKEGNVPVDWIGWFIKLVVGNDHLVVGIINDNKKLIESD